MTLLDTVCTNCGCHSHHNHDSTHPVRWCTRCGAGCWYTPTQPAPVIPIPAPLEPFGRAVNTAICWLNSWLGNTIRL